MTTVQATLSKQLERERASLLSGTRLHAFHWVILLFSVLLTLAAWYFAKTQSEKSAALQFDREASQVVELVSERMSKYEDALWAGVAALHSNGGQMNYDEWHSFAQSLHIDTKYPGINGIGIVLSLQDHEVHGHLASERRARAGYKLHPPVSAGEHLPIVYIEPEMPNAKAVGLDLAFEENRREAAMLSRDTGLAQITAPIVLVQDEKQTPGFLFYAPFYKGVSHDTLAERRKNFLGMVYAPFVVEKLLAGTLDKSKRFVGLRLVDGATVLYDEHHDSEADYDPNPLFTSQVAVDVYGRSWTFDIWSTQAFRDATATSQPGLILAGGIAIDVLLLSLFLLFSSTNRRTLRFADRMNRELQLSAEKLVRSNAELESFAYVASHDLRTPLRGISDLTAYLEEDLESYIGSPDANPDVQHNLQRLERQTDRMDNLIRGILDYSGVGVRREPEAEVLLSDVIDTIREVLGVDAGQVVLEGESPQLMTYKLRFEQVMQNLIGNAFKYHHDPEHALVTIRCRDDGDWFTFSVSDNGPGIDPKFHARIFEVFQTLQSRDKIESTGVGLSIVKKSVENLGGTVGVVSAPGEGTTFEFTWPKTTRFVADEVRKVV